MKTHFKNSLVWIAVIATATRLSAQQPAQRMDSLVNAVRGREAFDGTILVTEKGRVVYEHSFGLPNNGYVFNLASVSKMFTAVAILQLVGQGKLQLSEDIRRYFPELSYNGVTINNLLNHTSGLVDYMADPVRNRLSGSPDNAAVLAAYAAAALKPQFPPGSNWRYSNTNFLLLALIVEKVSGLSYPAYLQRHIFRPARMRQSFVLAKNVPESLKSQLAPVYYYPDLLSIRPVLVDSLPFAKAQYQLIANTCGDGGVFSTVEDLSRFHQALLKGKLLDKKLQCLMYSMVTLPEGKNYEAGNANPDYMGGYGLGCIVARDSSYGKVVWHSGADPGLLTFFMRNLDRDQCVIVLNNNWYRGSYHLGGSLMNMLNGRPAQLLGPSLARQIGMTYTLHGADSAIRLLDSLKRKNSFHIGFLEMNELGYDLLAKSDSRTAIAVFRVNTDTYPKSGDAWDSLAEAEYKAGDKSDALRDYDLSVKLNPDNENGKTMINKIRNELHQ
jgi:CubicO group peptidase (beta-lactamase class C family)